MAIFNSVLNVVLVVMAIIDTLRGKYDEATFCVVLILLNR